MIIEVTSKNREMGIASLLGNSHRSNENASFVELQMKKESLFLKNKILINRGQNPSCEVSFYVPPFVSLFVLLCLFLTHSLSSLCKKTPSFKNAWVIRSHSIKFASLILKSGVLRTGCSIM